MGLLRGECWVLKYMLMPKRTKYRRTQKGQMPGKAWRGSEVAFGEYGLKAEGRGFVTSRQLEAARKAVSHCTKRGGKLWIRAFPHKPLTKKPSEVRMGSGKGAVDHYVAVVKPGKMLFEISGVTEELAKEALNLAAAKISVATRFVKAEE